MNITEFQDTFYGYNVARKYKDALQLVDHALASGIPAERLATDGISETLKKLQGFFDDGYTTVPAFQLFAIGKICEDSLEKIKARVASKGPDAMRRKIVLGTIKTDFHGLGKKVVQLFLEVNGFEVIDLGLDVPPETFVDTAERVNADFIFVSTMMLQNMIGVKKIGELIDQRGLRGRVKFLVGGAPFNYNLGLVQKVGADGHAATIYELLDMLAGKARKQRSVLGRLKRFFTGGK